MESPLNLESLDEDSGDDTAEGRDSDIDLLLDSVRDPIDRLYKLSTRIRNPSSRLGSSKALQHQQIDEDSGINLFQAVEKFEYDYISSVFLQYQKSKALEEYQTVKPPEDKVGEDKADNVWEPIRTVLSQYQTDLLNGTESFLVRRIARANVRRRQQFAYWKKHRDKLTHHMKTFTQHVEAHKEITPNPIAEKQANKISIPMLAPAQSVTTASRLIIPQLDGRDDRSTISVSEYAPSAWRPSKEVVGFPAPPKRRPSIKFFECPYCFVVCSTELLADKAWK